MDAEGFLVGYSTSTRPSVREAHGVKQWNTERKGKERKTIWFLFFLLVCVGEVVAV